MADQVFGEVAFQAACLHRAFFEVLGVEDRPGQRVILVVLQQCRSADLAVGVGEQLLPCRAVQMRPSAPAGRRPYQWIGVGCQSGQHRDGQSGEAGGLLADAGGRVGGEPLVCRLGELCAPFRREHGEDPSPPGLLLAEDQASPLFSCDVRLGLGQQLPQLPLRMGNGRIYDRRRQLAPEKVMSEAQQAGPYVIGRRLVERQPVRPHLGQPLRRTGPLEQRCPGGLALLRGLLGRRLRCCLLPLSDPVHGDEPDLVLLGCRAQQCIPVHRERDELRLPGALAQHSGDVPLRGELYPCPAPGCAARPVAGDVDEEHAVLEREPVPLRVELGNQIGPVSPYGHGRLGPVRRERPPCGPRRQHVLSPPVPDFFQPGAPQQLRELSSPTHHGSPSCLSRRMYTRQ